jgi:hypothetical protein
MKKLWKVQLELNTTVFFIFGKYWFVFVSVIVELDGCVLLVFVFGRGEERSFRIKRNMNSE